MNQIHPSMRPFLWFAPTSSEDAPSEVREEMAKQRSRRARMNHFCSDCMGFDGPGSPCYDPQDSEGEEEHLP